MSDTRHPIIAAIGPTGGEAALTMAQILAGHSATAVVVLSVVEPPPLYDISARRVLLDAWPIEHQVAERRQAVVDRLHKVAGHVGHESDPTIEIAFGAPAVTISDVACNMDARLIVMGAGPFEARRRLFAAGTALQTSRRAPCTVFAVSGVAQALPRCVVVATDFSAASLAAALEALPLLADDASIYLVHAWERIGTAADGDRLRAIDDAYAAALPERFARARALLANGHTRRIVGTAREGRPAEAVLRFAGEVRADLLVIGTRGLGNVARLVAGSVSSAIFRGSTCSVLLVPPPDAVHTARIERHMTGTSTVTVPDAWAAELESFAGRNRQRRTALELDDRTLGAQVQQSGYLLAGATYDPHDRRIELMFEQTPRSGVHFTHTLGRVRSVDVRTSTRGADDALCIESDEGIALLTFLTSPAADRREP